MVQHSCKNGVKGCIACGVRKNLQDRLQLLLQEKEKLDEILQLYEGKEWLFEETDKFLYKRPVKLNASINGKEGV